MGELVGDDAHAPVGVERAEGRPHDEEPLRGHLGRRAAPGRSRGPAESESAARPPTPLMRAGERAGGARLARHDDEVALAQPRPLRARRPSARSRSRARRSGPSICRPRGAITTKWRERVLGDRPDLPRMALAAARLRADAPALAGADGGQAARGGEGAPDAADAVARADLELARRPLTSEESTASATSRSRSGAALRAASRSRRRCGPVAVAAYASASPRLERLRAAPEQGLERGRRPPRARRRLARGEVGDGAASRLAGPPQPARAGGRRRAAPARPTRPARARAAAERRARARSRGERLARQRGRVAAGEPAQRGRADVGERAVVAAAAVALEAREQRGVLAGVVRAGRGRVAAVVGGDARAGRAPGRGARASRRRRRRSPAARAWKPGTSPRWP